MKTAGNRLARTVGRLFILIGSLVAIGGAVSMGRTASFVLRASKAPGVVIEMERSSSSARGSTFMFADDSDIVHTQRLSSGSSPTHFKPGDEVTVLFDSFAPDRSKIGSRSQAIARKREIFLTSQRGPR